MASRTSYCRDTYTKCEVWIPLDSVTKCQMFTQQFKLTAQHDRLNSILSFHTLPCWETLKWKVRLEIEHPAPSAISDMHAHCHVYSSAHVPRYNWCTASGWAGLQAPVLASGTNDVWAINLQPHLLAPSRPILGSVRRQQTCGWTRRHGNIKGSSTWPLRKDSSYCRTLRNRVCFEFATRASCWQFVAVWLYDNVDFFCPPWRCYVMMWTCAWFGRCHYSPGCDPAFARKYLQNWAWQLLACLETPGGIRSASGI